MTASTRSRSGELRGAQRPRFDVAPASRTSASGDEAVELAAQCGLVLDDWQQHVLRQSLGERPDGSWASFEVGLVVARQNGKGGVLLARELAGVLLFGEKLIIHSAHEAETARNHMLEWLALIERSPLLRQKVKSTPMGRGSESIEFRNGARIRFRTRTRGGGRGLSGDLVVIDEAFELPAAAQSALLPTLSARPNPQIWYASSAVDQMVHPNGMVLASLRKRALSDAPGRLTWCEWSALDADDPSDPAVWAEANPALGIRISLEYLEAEFRALLPRAHQVERLSVGDWPDPDGTDLHEGPLDLDAWTKLGANASPATAGPVVFAADVNPDRTAVTIAAAGWRSDGRLLVEIVDQVKSPQAAAARVAELVAAHETAAVVVDGYGGLDDLMERAGVTARVTGAADVANACGRFVDLINDGTVVHLADPLLNEAVRHAKTRKLAGGFAWARQGGGDVSPLVAVTLAVFGADAPVALAPEPFVFVS